MEGLYGGMLPGKFVKISLKLVHSERFCEYKFQATPRYFTDNNPQFIMLRVVNQNTLNINNCELSANPMA